MTTPLVMIAILVIPWLIAYLSRGTRSTRAVAGVVGLVLLFLFTASGHFIQTAAMAEMLPPFVPARVPLVYFTGILEVALAIGIAFPATRQVFGWAAIVVLIGFFPANVHAALNHVEMGGHRWGAEYLLLRTPVQILLVLWTWHFTVKPGKYPIVA
jgi:uncharacterized membrane protein